MERSLYVFQLVWYDNDGRNSLFAAVLVLERHGEQPRQLVRKAVEVTVDRALKMHVLASVKQHRLLGSERTRRQIERVPCDLSVPSR
jgi:hypothetical protein